MHSSMTGSSHVERLLAPLAIQPERPFLLLEEGPRSRSLSFSDVDLLARRYASRLLELGLRTGDTVALLADSSPESIAALVAHLRLGIVTTPINTRYRAEEAGHILEDSGAKAVLFDDGEEEGRGAATLDAIPSHATPELRHRLSVSEAFAPGASPSFLSKHGSPPSAFPSGLSDSDTALLIYTSGTTGESKGVELSYRAVTENTLAVTDLWRFSHEDVLSLALPLFHVHGLCLGVLGSLLRGMAIRLHARFDAARVVSDFALGATVFMGVPTMYVKLLDLMTEQPEAARTLARGRLFTSGSAPLPAGDFRAFREWTGQSILERYGMTETLFTLSNPYDGERRPGTVGQPVSGCTVRIVDEDGADVPANEPGEIVVKSNGLMTGYRGRPGETAACFRHGWFLTGDVARREADGYVALIGRRSVDIIKSGGFKISAREIEDCLRRHPDVKDAAVVGVPDRVFGQRIVAAVVKREGHGQTTAGSFEKEIVGFVSEHLADYKRPKRVLILPELPVNAMGKIQKHVLLRSLGETK